MAIPRPRMISPFYGHPIDNIPDLLKPNIIGLKATKLLKDFEFGPIRDVLGLEADIRK